MAENKTPTKKRKRGELTESVPGSGKHVYVWNKKLKKKELIAFDPTNHVHQERSEKKRYGGYTIPYRYLHEGKQRAFKIQTGVCTCILGLKTFDDGNRGAEIEMDPSTLQTVSAVDLNIQKDIAKNRKNWIPGVSKKKYPDSELWKLFDANSREREYEGEQQKPRLNVSITQYSSGFRKNEDGEVVPMEELQINPEGKYIFVLTQKALFAKEDRQTYGWFVDEVLEVEEGEAWQARKKQCTI